MFFFWWPQTGSTSSSLFRHCVGGSSPTLPASASSSAFQLQPDIGEECVPNRRIFRLIRHSIYFHLFLCFRSTFLGNLELEARFKFWPASVHSSGRTDGCQSAGLILLVPSAGVLLILHLLGRNGRASLTREGLFCMIMPPPDRGRVGELESALRIHPSCSLASSI